VKCNLRARALWHHVLTHVSRYWLGVLVDGCFWALTRGFSTPRSVKVQISVCACQLQHPYMYCYAPSSSPHSQFPTSDTLMVYLQVQLCTYQLHLLPRAVVSGSLVRPCSQSRSGPHSLCVYRVQLDDDLPGGGQYYCIACSKYFISGNALEQHNRTKPHKRRLGGLVKLKQQGMKPHCAQDAEAAAGMGKPDNGTSRGNDGCLLMVE
jgi:hypothetical protein